MSMKNRRYPFVQLLVVPAMAWMPGLLMAHGKATGIVKERMQLMKTMGKQMRTIGLMAKGKIPFSAETVGNRAEKIRLSSTKIQALFPEGSLHKPTEALPVIWEQWDQFLSLAKQLEQEAETLEKVAVQGDEQMTLAQFTKLGETCSGCHTDFREKDE